ncbi:MAG: D-aminoacylase [Pseudomonadota bacterium]
MNRNVNLFRSGSENSKRRRVLGELYIYGVFVATLSLMGCSGHTPSSPSQPFDVIVRGGTVYDGSGDPGEVMDIAVVGDRIAAMGDLRGADAVLTVDASGKAVSPGFINMLSWGVDSLIEDGRGVSDIAQGVTLEVFGEGISMGPVPPGPLSPELLASFDLNEGERPPWTSLGDYLKYLEDKGVAPNVASFVGATTLRIHELGFENRPPSSDELLRMQELAREAMREGAMGLGSSLIYAPAFFADTQELIALASAVAEFDGMYISHLRSEGDRIDEAIDELLTIAKEADVRAEIYHLKLAGRKNWARFEEVIAQIEKAREAGLDVATDMYTYTAGATGLTAGMPPWSGEGGINGRIARIKDPVTRARILEEMRSDQDEWENLLQAAGASGVLVTSFKNEAMKQYEGMRLSEIADRMNLSPEETVLELIDADGSRVGAIYFLMTEENVAKKVALPWMSFGSDAETRAASSEDRLSPVHPRTYGTFARVLGKFVREENVISLAEAIRKMSALPAHRLRITDRGKLERGYFADIVVFDPATVADKATFADPHQLAVGVEKVFVNGELVWNEGAATGRLPGRFVRGPGYRVRQKEVVSNAARGGA